ncbi:unnamed protein product, partial [Phaeothamnion confervicola]
NGENGGDGDAAAAAAAAAAALGRCSGTPAAGRARGVTAAATPVSAASAVSPPRSSFSAAAEQPAHARGASDASGGSAAAEAAAADAQAAADALDVRGQLADIRVALVSNFHGVPLFHVDVRELQAAARQVGQLGMDATLHAVLAAGYFNDKFYCWEPALEDTPVMWSLHRGASA